MNSECTRDKACINNKCRDPCPGTCGLNAECVVNNHAPSCLCIAGYTGNPAVACRLPLPSTYFLLFDLFSTLALSLSASRGGKTQSLPAVTLWTLQSVSGHQRSCGMFLSSQLYRNSPCMSTGMHDQFRLCPRQGLC